MTLLPPREGISYLPHQEDGIRWMLEREQEDSTFCRGGILADDMGLGKTFQTIGLIKNSTIKKTLILCPPILMGGWEEELSACGFRVRLRLPGVPRFTDSTAYDSGDRDGDVWLMSYSQSIQFPYLQRLMAFQRVVLDEGHVIRNPGTLLSEACCALTELSVSRWILSATPIQNGTKDWKNLSRFLSDGKASDAPSTIMLRRTMEELRHSITLPPTPVFITHSLQMENHSHEKRLFHLLSNQLSDAIESRQISTFLTLERYLRLQQFIVHPQIYTEAMQDKYKGAYSQSAWNGHSTKWDGFCKVLHESSEPTIVFCQFRKEIKFVVDEACQKGARVFTICGGIGSTEIANTVRAAKLAHSLAERVVVVVQIATGGCGLNLQFCTRILFLSKHWNPAVVFQAVGRAVRIGQHSIVNIHSFIILDNDIDLNNLDLRMYEMHKIKIAEARTIYSSLYNGF